MNQPERLSYSALIQTVMRPRLLPRTAIAKAKPLAFVSKDLDYV